MLKFRPPPVDTKLELGSSARIRCEADGQSPPQVYWRRRGFESNLGEGVEDVAGVLLFEDVTYEHAGVYTCEATSDQGRINKTIEVQVVGEWYLVVLRYKCLILRRLIFRQSMCYDI